MASSGGDAYEIDQSICFDRADDAYLKRTPSSAGNLRTWTLSWWMKRCDSGSGSITASQIIFGVGDLGASATPHSHNIYFRGDSNDRLSFEQWSGSGTTSYGGTTRREFTDIGSWTHFVVIQDSTDSTSGDRFRFYINGVRETDIPWGTALTSNWDGLINTTTAHFIGGSDPDGDNRHSDMYLAEIHFIDGTVKAVGNFGETDSATNQWIPIEYTGGSYGTNGFYLPFKKNDRYSVYFDGSTSTGIEINDSSDFDMGSGDMTCEMWFYVDEDAGTYRRLCGQSDSGANASQIPFAIEIDTNNKPVGYLFYSGANYETMLSSTAINDNEWNHVALVRNSGTATLYLNGTSVYSQSTSVTLNTSSGKFGIGQLGEYTSDTFKGWISNFRLVVGSAVYTSNFTPSTSPLTAVTNTEILCCQDSTATTDNSGNSRTLTVTAANTYTEQMAPFVYDWYQDHSGQNNHWTPDNLTVNDVSLDTPTNNFCMLNSLSNASGALSQGNLKIVSATSNRATYSTIGMTSGKWYWEISCTDIISGGGMFLGVGNSPDVIGSASWYSAGFLGISTYDGKKYNNGLGSNANYIGSGQADGDIVSVALDLDNSKMWFAVNGTWAGSGDPAAGSNSLTDSTYALPSGHVIPIIGRGGGYNETYICNFGQNGTFAGTKIAQGNTDSSGVGNFYYSVPSGFKAISSKNLPSVTIKKPGGYFNTVLYTGSGAVDKDVTGVGFQPDLSWIKCRSETMEHVITDAVRGAGNIIKSNDTSAEADWTDYVGPILSDGIRLNDVSQGDAVNKTDATYAIWNWKASGGSGSANTQGDIDSTVSVNDDAGFSIVTYTGNRTGAGVSTVGHGLSSAPKVVITKSRSNVTNWWMQHAGTTAASNLLQINTQDQPPAQVDKSSNGTLSRPTSTVFGTNYTDGLGTNGHTMVAYCWAEVEGYSKFGSFTGNSSSNGPFIFTNFLPAWILIKKATATGRYSVWDNKRNTFNPVNSILAWNSTYAEGTGSTWWIEQHSNGFKIRTSETEVNLNNATMIYMAFAASPFKTSNAR